MTDGGDGYEAGLSGGGRRIEEGGHLYHRNEHLVHVEGNMEVAHQKLREVEMPQYIHPILQIIPLLRQILHARHHHAGVAYKDVELLFLSVRGPSVQMRIVSVWHNSLQEFSSSAFDAA